MINVSPILRSTGLEFGWRGSHNQQRNTYPKKKNQRNNDGENYCFSLGKISLHLEFRLQCGMASHTFQHIAYIQMCSTP